MTQRITLESSEYKHNVMCGHEAFPELPDGYPDLLSCNHKELRSLTADPDLTQRQRDFVAGVLFARVSIFAGTNRQIY